MAYARMTPSDQESQEIAGYIADNETAAELVEGLEKIFKNENLDENTLSIIFQDAEKRAEKLIHLHANFSNHLIDLNRQLRAAAAVFVLVFSSTFLMGFKGYEGVEHFQTEQYGPYDLAHGSKVAP